MTDLPSRLTAALADRFAIERELDSGGMATVYLAEDAKHRPKDEFHNNTFSLPTTALGRSLAWCVR